MSKASLIPVSSELIKEVNKELYSFIRLKMLDLEFMLISAQRIMRLKKYVEN